ncbi:DUF3883 domain-containing protein [Variovorax sp. J22R115]|uniref:DUF3883 domain-containing protein n=1 Tax=Variovorax sp. J22R115 TaxID=3053509 RepID=UPI002577F093|nr:DUF3883 domain-containing protein [Variovorax sp. J22R115]MDM0053056.1 DUF3883 domain-containing protein [Variovorax sp. J22R115]
MRHEVPEKVLAVIDGYLRDKGKQNIYEVLERLGVRDVKVKIYDYVWEVPTGAPIFTIWAEEVGVHPVFGYMFSVEDTATRTTRRGGAAMDAGQLQRTNDRRRLMEKVRDGQPFIAVLQTNERSNGELMRNVTSKPDDRVKDSPWRVARWDTARQRAILVRGENDWAPTDSEVDQFLRHGRIHHPDGTPDPVEPSEEDNPAAPRLVFPDQAHRDLVESKSMEKIAAVFIEQGLNPEDVSSENRGYDLDVQNASGVSVYHVEVKGTAASAPGFFLTRNELKRSESDPLWELAVVTDALGTPQVDRYTGKEMQKFFDFEPLVLRGELKPSS